MACCWFSQLRSLLHATKCNYFTLLPVNYYAYTSYMKKTYSFLHTDTNQFAELNIDQLAENIQGQIGFSSRNMKDNITDILQTFNNLKVHRNPTHHRKISNLIEQDDSMENSRFTSEDPSCIDPSTNDVEKNQLHKHYIQIQKCLIKHWHLFSENNKSATVSEIIKVLHGNLGFGTKVIVRLLTMNPEIFEMNVEDLLNRISNLRANGLREGFLQRSISHTPQYLSMAEEKMNQMIDLLIRDLDFTVKDLPELFLYSPQVFFQPFDKTEEKFQYIYFTMGYKKHYVIARHGILRYDVQHIKTRHLFLERRGQFQLADKNQTTTIANPNLKYIICYPDKKFCSDVAHCTVGEYYLFKSIISAEDRLQKQPTENTDIKDEDFADKLISEMTK